jgi:hypothetical protein
MRVRKSIAAIAVGLAVLAGTGDDASGLPGPPGPPAGGGPRGPGIGPSGGPRPGGIRGPGGVGGPGGPGGIQRPGGVGGPGRAPTFGGPRAPGGAPGGRGPERLPEGIPGQGRPGGIGPGWRPQGPAQIPGAQGIGGPASSHGLGGLGSLAKSSDALVHNSSTFPVNQQSLANTRDSIRNSLNQNNKYNFFQGDWSSRYPNSWYAAAWASGSSDAYSYADWSTAYRYCRSYQSEPVYYDYGSTVVYEGDTVYVNGSSAGTQQQYAQQATSIAETGQQAAATKDEDWLSLGVFAMTQGGQSSSNDLFQLAVNKSGVIRGNYYSALSDTTLPVCGSVDPKTQRAAWKVGDRKEPVFEAGFANLTKSETTMLVHFAEDRTQQWNLVRIEQPPQRE